MAYKRSNFPNSYLELPELHDLSPSLINKAEEYKALLIKPNKTVTEIERLNQLKSELQNYTISPEWINTLGDEISATQKYFVENTLDYVNQLKTDTQNYTESKKVEFQAEVDKFNLVGNYSPTVQYYKKNMVRFNGQIYLCIKDSYNNAPLDNGDSEFWILHSKKGDKGEQGVAGVGLTFKNEYSPTTTYNPNEAVQYNGSVYYCISTVVGEVPSENGVSWRLFLARSGLVVSSSNPSSTTDKMVWVDSSTNKFKYFDAAISKWIELNANNADKLGGKPLSQIEDEIDYKIGTHKSKIASTTTLGHVKVDGETIVIDENGVISSISDGIEVGEVENLTANENSTVTQFTINWINPTAPEFIKVEAYISSNDISNSNRDYCLANATKFADGNITTGNATVVNNTLYYIKVFAVYRFLGATQYSEGISISKLAKDETPPSSILNFVASKGNAQVTLTWTNPVDSDFSKTKILYKTGNYPTSPTDGIVAYEGSGNTVKINDLINDTEYFFRAFTYDNNGNINNIEIGQQVSATPKAYVIYGVKIDTLNSNPETALTYTDGAIGFTPSKGNNGAFTYGSWQDKFPFNQIKPCVLKNGVVQYYLNPNDYTKKLDGSNADITSGNAGDVMVEFPKIYWKFETIGNYLYIRYSDTRVDNSYKALAHTRGSAEKDFVYISAYMGYTISSELRSLSGKTPTTSQTIGTFRTRSQANGTGYDQMAYYQLLMLQVLFIVMFKNRDSQTALGRGYVDGNDGAITTGGTNTKGMFYGESTGKLQNKFCGIEDFWGNIYYWIDGMYSDANRNILIGNQNFNDTGSGYTNYGQGATSNLGGYIGKVQGGTESGFIIKSSNGSETTHYCDYGTLNASCLPIFGGYWNYTSYAGAFLLRVDYSASFSNMNISARLLFL